MDGHGHPQDDACGPPQTDEASLRAMLEQSRRDIAAGRTVPLQDVIVRLQATADRLMVPQDAPALHTRQE